MRKLTLTTYLSLDGVTQGPGGPTEDPSGGFQKGGWLPPYMHEDFGRIMSEWMDAAGGFILGRQPDTGVEISLEDGNLVVAQPLSFPRRATMEEWAWRSLRRYGESNAPS